MMEMNIITVAGVFIVRAKTSAGRLAARVPKKAAPKSLPVAFFTRVNTRYPSIPNAGAATRERLGADSDSPKNREAKKVAARGNKSSFIIYPMPFLGGTDAESKELYKLHSTYIARTNPTPAAIAVADSRASIPLAPPDIKSP